MCRPIKICCCCLSHGEVVTSAVVDGLDFPYDFNGRSSNCIRTDGPVVGPFVVSKEAATSKLQGVNQIMFLSSFASVESYVGQYRREKNIDSSLICGIPYNVFYSS